MTLGGSADMIARMTSSMRRDLRFRLVVGLVLGAWWLAFSEKARAEDAQPEAAEPEADEPEADEPEADEPGAEEPPGPGRAVLLLGSVELRPDLKIYADYQVDLASEDYDNAFHLRRAYLGLRARIASWLSGRVTYDISQVTDVGRAGDAEVRGGEAEVEASRLEGSLVARLKYAYLHLGIERLSLGLRFGVVQTPFIGWVEHIEETRFLRKVMVEQAYGYPSADFGLALIGSIRRRLTYHVGLYNGEGYHGLESTRFKDLIARVSWRPAPDRQGLSGLQLTGYVQVELAPGEGVTHRRYGGALTYRLAEEILDPDCQRVRGEVLAAWVQVFGGQQGPADELIGSLGVSVGARLELPARLFVITRLDRFDPDLDTDGDLIWTLLATLGMRIWDGPVGTVIAALAYQGRLYQADADQQLLGLHVELHL